MEHATDSSELIYLILRTEGIKKSFQVQEGESRILKTASGQVTIKHGGIELPDSTDYESDPVILALLGA
jgi:hypothetical protein